MAKTLIGASSRSAARAEVLGDLVARAPGRGGATLEHGSPCRRRAAALGRADHRRVTGPGERLVGRRTGLAALVPATLAPFSPPSSVRAAQMERRETVRTRPLGPRSSVVLLSLT